MSSTHDVVGLAVADVRVPISELSVEQRMRLLTFYCSSISRHYHVHRGGSNFIPWEQGLDKFRSSRYDMNLTAERIEDLPKRYWPKEEDYNSNTRVFPLFIQKFFLPGLLRPHSYHWRKGAEVVCVRLCLTQTGAIYLEWYEGKHTDRDVAVCKSKHLPISTLGAESEGSKILLTLLERQPNIVETAGGRIIRLLHSDASEREQRAARDRKLFNELNTKGELFGITYRP